MPVDLREYAKQFHPPAGVPKGCSDFWTVKQKMRVIRVHYSANPAHDPDTPEGQRWVREKSAEFTGGMKGPAWQREMEINWKNIGSALVWPDFPQMETYLAIDPEELFENFVPEKIPEHWQLYGGYDFGNKNPFAFVVIAFDGETCAYQIEEIVASGCSAGRQAELIKESPYFSRLQAIYGDPSIWHTDQNIGQRVTSVGEILEGEGVSITRAKKVDGIDRAFINLLDTVLWRQLDHARFKFFSTCPQTLRSFRRVHYIDWATAAGKNSKPNPEKITERGVDPFDAVKYVLTARWQGEDPDDLGAPKGSVDWLMETLQAAKTANAYIFR